MGIGTEDKQLEQLTADLAWAIQFGMCKSCPATEPKQHISSENVRFTTEVRSPTEIVVTDADNQQYRLVVEKIN